MESLAKAAGDAVRNGDTVIHPASLEPRWFAWVDDMHDWCISRQLWWGHRIPIWHGPDGQKVCVGPDETPPDGWEHDSDVLDTWFSSALWPFATLGWPDETPDLETFYPGDLNTTARDIIRLWENRMIFSGLEMIGDVPFTDVVIHSLVHAPSGGRMSKSLGTGMSPLALID